MSFKDRCKNMGDIHLVTADGSIDCQVKRQGRTEDISLPGAETFFVLEARENSLPLHLFSHFTWGAALRK